MTARKPRNTWKPYRVTCYACYRAGFRYPVLGCLSCERRRAEKAERRASANRAA